MDVDSHLEAAHEERHEVDLSYDDRYHPELAGEDMNLEDDWNEDRDDAPEPSVCNGDPCECGNGCDEPGPTVAPSHWGIDDFPF